jgi:hypothetical protein
MSNNPPDPFDPKTLRLDQNFAEGPPTQRVFTVIPVRRPGPQHFIRVHPEYWYPALVYKSETERETYVVVPTMASALSDQARPVILRPTITRQGDLALWPVPMPRPDGRACDWHVSAQRAAELAITQWTRIAANMGTGTYDTLVAMGTIPDPVWPELTMDQMVRIAFRNRIVDTEDHPIVKQLLGL